MTLKQRQFVKKYIENNGNATQAAIEAYDVNNRHTAESIGSENLRKPEVQREIEIALERAGLSDNYISEILRKATIAGLGIKARNADALRGLDMILKLKEAYPRQVNKTAHLRINMNQNANKSYTEFIKDVERLDQTTQELLADLKQ